MFTRLRDARHDEGFTLIELLIVIIILGILAAIVIFAVGGLSGQGATEACKTDGKTIDTAAEAYYAKNGNYPTNLAPTLTSGQNIFLKWDTSFVDSAGNPTAAATDTSVQRNGSGYTILYDPTSHDVWAAPGTGSTPDATTTCP